MPKTDEPTLRELMEAVYKCRPIPKDDMLVLQYLLFRIGNGSSWAVSVDKTAQETRVSRSQVYRILQRWGDDGLKVIFKFREKGYRAKRTGIKKRRLLALCTKERHLLESMLARLLQPSQALGHVPGGDATVPAPRRVTVPSSGTPTKQRRRGDVARPIGGGPPNDSDPKSAAQNGSDRLPAPRRAAPVVDDDDPTMITTPEEIAEAERADTAAAAERARTDRRRMLRQVKENMRKVTT